MTINNQEAKKHLCMDVCLWEEIYLIVEKPHDEIYVGNLSIYCVVPINVICDNNNKKLIFNKNVWNLLELFIRSFIWIIELIRRLKQGVMKIEKGGIVCDMK